VVHSAGGTRAGKKAVHGMGRVNKPEGTAMLIRFAACLLVAAMGIGAASAATLAPVQRYAGGPTGGLLGHTHQICVPHWVIVGYRGTVAIERNTCTGEEKQMIN
jgi:hypothetical protein